MSGPVGARRRDERFPVTRGGLRVVLRVDALKAACASRGWSLAELGRQAHVSRPTLTAAIHGKAVQPRTAFRISQALSRAEATPPLLDLCGRD